MEQQNPATPSTVPPTTTATVIHPADPSPVRPPPQQLPQIPANIQHQHPPQQLAPQPPSSSALAPAPTPTPTPNPNPNPLPRPSTPLVLPQSQSNTVTSAAPRPHRPWQHPHPHTHFQHFSSPSPPTPVPSLSSAASPPISTQQQRGGVAIGVPAAHPSPFTQPFAGLNRGPVSMPESAANSTASQVRHGMQGIPGVGVMSSIGSSSQMRPGGIPAHQQQRPFQSSIRPSPAPSTQAPNTQNFQGHSFMRPSGGLTGSSAPNTSQSMQSPNQPWLSSGAQGKPPIPPPSYRAQMNTTQSLQQRPHVLQQHHSVLANTPQQQHVPTSQAQQSLTTQAAGEQHGQQVSSSRVPQPLSQMQQIPRAPASIIQKQPLQVIQQPAALQTVNKAANADNDETSSRILSKRSIQDLVSQIDPSERLDPDVEDILADIADDFVESITTFGCSLAKHRKSDTLEAKDILLHLEKNWNITLPGFSGDEIKTYRKPLTNDIHKERLAAIRKSVLVSETGTGRNVGQAPGSGRSNLTKTPVNPMVSPPPNLTKTN
ncbi:Transcription initiation factor TFIID subunit 12 [Linum perenne]